MDPISLPNSSSLLDSNSWSSLQPSSIRSSILSLLCHGGSSSVWRRLQTSVTQEGMTFRFRASGSIKSHPGLWTRSQQRYATPVTRTEPMNLSSLHCVQARANCRRGRALRIGGLPGRVSPVRRAWGSRFHLRIVAIGTLVSRLI
jgi:hypothetical protein